MVKVPVTYKQKGNSHTAATTRHLHPCTYHRMSHKCTLTRSSLAHNIAQWLRLSACVESRFVTVTTKYASHANGRFSISYSRIY
jgi:hypothetical protein